jgi:hypothetical protein
MLSQGCEVNMRLSQLARLAVIACAALWLAAPTAASWPLQGDSPITTPLNSPIPNPLGSPIAGDPFGLGATPVADPALCSPEDVACVDGTPAPAGQEFETFLPGISDPAAGTLNQPPGPPPDLGTLLNGAAIAVVVVGVTLKLYWFISDRRKQSNAQH